MPDEGAFRVTWTPPDENTHLEVVRSSGDPETCPTSYDADRADWLSEEGSNTWLVSAHEPRECVTFFAVTSLDGVSPGSSVHLQKPVPDAPKPPAPEWLETDGQWRFTWAPPLSTGLGVIRNSVDPATCPEGTDDWTLLEQSGGDRWLLAPNVNVAIECVLLVAYTEWGTVSAGTEVRLSIPGTGEAPDVGTPVWVPDEGAFRVTWTPPDENTHLEVVRPFDPDSCPASYEDGFQEETDPGGPGLRLVRASQVTECVLFFAVSTSGVSPGTQVVLQVPPPAATVVPVVGTVTYDLGYPEVSVSLAYGRYDLGVEVRPGACAGRRRSTRTGGRRRGPARSLGSHPGVSGRPLCDVHGARPVQAARTGGVCALHDRVSVLGG